MQRRWWLAVAVIAVWLDQAIYLWPLPSEVAAQSAVGSDPNAAEALAWWESQLWLGWIMRIVAIPLGVLSGVLLLKNHRKWPVVLLVISVVCLVLFRTWQWLHMYAPLFTSRDRATGRGTWLLEHPQFIVNSLVFPVVLVVAAICGAVAIARHRRESHAI